jgi:hypothetical protein
MNKIKTSQESLIEQPHFGCSRYVALRDVLGKIEETAAVPFATGRPLILIPVDTFINMSFIYHEYVTNLIT